MTGIYLPKKGVNMTLQPGVNQMLSTVNSVLTHDATKFDPRTPTYSTAPKFNERHGHDVINWKTNVVDRGSTQYGRRRVDPTVETHKDKVDMIYWTAK